MYDQEPLERFLYRINRKQTWAGLFSFAMTVLGLVAVMSLVVLTVWGFASYNAANNKLIATDAELANSQKKVNELSAVVNSNTAGAELNRVRTELANVQSQITQRDQEITDLKNQLNNNSAPSSPSNPTTDSDKDKRIQELLDLNKNLQNQLDKCRESAKRPTKDTGRTTIIQ